MNDTKINDYLLRKMKNVKIEKQKLNEEIISIKLSGKYLWFLKDLYEKEYKDEIKSFSVFVKQIVVCFAENEGREWFGGQYGFECAWEEHKKSKK
ncbi:MAG: hypothetical protein LBB39_02170 [Mycoplasmataceae bacterium]|nr:hypothetical protein [Mycoplasmataceae bacterium]